MSNYHNNKKFRTEIQKGTIESFNNGYYYTDSKKKVDIPKDKMISSINNTIKYSIDMDYKELKFVKLSTVSNVQVIEGDCLNVAFDFQNKGYNPVVLNMASASHPGGGYMNGAGAQEESLFRRTNLFQCLDGENVNKLYPICGIGNIYTKDAIVIAKAEADSYDFFDEPKYMSFVASAAYKCSKSNDNDFINFKLPNGDFELRLNDKVASLTRAKINNIFRTAILNKHDMVILSAFGNGAYGNPPYHMARLFKQVIEDNKYNEYIHIIFAIINDSNAFNNHEEGNLAPYKLVFDSK